jgi:predicted DCC family thiol-disulfide oxidoreductase YuxK
MWLGKVCRTAGGYNRRVANGPVVLYDADCGLCRWTAAKLVAWDRRRILRLVRLQHREHSDRLLGDMDEERRMASWHLVVSDGRVFSGGEALAPLLALLPGGKPIARAVGAAQPLTNAAYRFVADRRSAFGKLLTAGTRRRADARLGERAS